MRTHQPKARDIKRDWHLVDAKDQILGRMASDIVRLLMGKHKVDYAPHMDMGDYVIVINAKNIEVTGKKKKQKKYFSHSGYPGGFKEIAFSKLKKEQPEKIIKLAVKRMLPANRLRDRRMRRLKIFVSDDYPYRDKFQVPSTKS